MVVRKEGERCRLFVQQETDKDVLLADAPDVQTYDAEGRPLTSRMPAPVKKGAGDDGYVLLSLSRSHTLEESSQTDWSPSKQRFQPVGEPSLLHSGLER